MQLPEFLTGNSLTRLFQGLAVGAIGTIAIGFIWGGWHLSSTVDEKVNTAGKTATIAALAPICADKFEQAANADNGLIVKIEAVESWERESHLIKAGWVTFPGGAKPNTNVAEACAILLNKTLKLK